MNGRIKVAVMATLVFGLIASAIYVAPTLAYMNGATDQTRDRDMDQIRDKDCTCDCDGDQYQNQTRTRLCFQEYAQNQTSLGAINWQYQYEHQYRHQKMLAS